MGNFVSFPVKFLETTECSKNVDNITNIFLAYAGHLVQELIFAGNVFLALGGKYEGLVLLKLLFLINLTKLNLKQQLFKRSDWK